MSLYRGLKKKKLKGIPCFRPILKDPTISDGAFRTLMLLKSKVQNGQVTTE